MTTKLRPTTGRRPQQDAVSDHGSAGELERVTQAMQPRDMGPRLAAALGLGAQPCHVVDAKYEPGVRATVLYRYGRQLVRGDLPAAPDDSACSQVAPVGGAVQPSGEPYRPLVAPGVRLSVFPHDPDLPSLPLLLTDQPALDLVALFSGKGHRPQPLRLRARVLRYRPGKRATLMFSSRPPGDCAIGKVYADPAKAAAVATEAVALAAAIPPNSVLRLATTTAHVPELAFIAQEAVPGTMLDVLVDHRRGCSPKAREAVCQAALALAELHALPVVSRRERSVDRELARFELRAARVATVAPMLGRQLEGLAQRLTDVAAILPPGSTGLVHGDCKPSQFLCTAGNVVLLDFDHCGVADPAADVGTFLASLRQLAVRHHLAGAPAQRVRDLAELEHVFAVTYSAASQQAAPQPRIQWYKAVALERKALRSFARAPRSPLTAALAAEAARCVDQLRWETT